MDRASTNQGSGGSKCVCIPRDCNFHGGNDDGFDSWNWGTLLRRVLGVKKIQPKLPNRSDGFPSPWSQAGHCQLVTDLIIGRCNEGELKKPDLLQGGKLENWPC